MNVDLYVRREAWSQHLDPRAKLAFTLLFSLTALILRWPLPMAGLLLLAHALAISSRVPATRLKDAWRALAPITFLIIILSSFTWEPTAVPAWLLVGPFQVTPASFFRALTMAIRVNVLAFAFLLLLWTTEQGELIAGLTRLGLPYAASLSLAIAMQFVPSFGRIFQEILEAQQSRGLVIPRNPIKAARSYVPVLIPLLITALRTADRLSMALSARGYDVGAPRTSRRQLRMASADWLVVGASILLVVAAAAAHFG